VILPVFFPHLSLFMPFYVRAEEYRCRLLAVTINPQSPGGLLLDSLRLQQALEESLQIPVYDVKKIEKVGKNR
jgi:hypothetical protein